MNNVLIPFSRIWHKFPRIWIVGGGNYGFVGIPRWGIAVKRLFNVLIILIFVACLLIACRAYFSWSVKRFGRRACEGI